MLARLAAIPGVTAARVDSSGRFFWLIPAAGADTDVLASLAVNVLGARAARLPADRAERQVASHARGDPWLGPDEVMTLSFVESRLLAVRLAGEASSEAGLSPAQREELSEAIRAGLFAAMERVHAEGGRKSSGWIYEAWPAIAREALDACAGPLPPDVRGRLSELLPGLLSR